MAPTGNPFTSEERRLLRRMVTASVLGGLGDTIIVAIAASGLDRSLLGTDNTSLFFLFLGMVILTVLIATRQRLSANRLAAEHVERLRPLILGHLLRLDLQVFDALQQGRVREALLSDTRTVSEAVIAASSVLLMAGSTSMGMLYLLFLSAEVFWLVSLALMLATVIMAVAILRVIAMQGEVERGDIAWGDAVRHLFDGFKELKLDERKRMGFLAETFEQAARQRETTRVRMGDTHAAAFVAMDSLVLATVAGVVFGLPLLEPVSTEIVIRASIVILFLPVAAVLQVPIALQAWSALDRLRSVAEELGERASADAPPSPAPFPASSSPSSGPVPAPSSGVETPMEQEKEQEQEKEKEKEKETLLAFRDVTFRYRDVGGLPGFALGPIGFEVPAGRITFLVGGNGSGKSTILKLAMSLYTPEGGALLVRGVPADAAQRRALTSAVFADTHLFDRLYGYRATDPDQINQWLERLQIADKTRYEHGRFTNLDLSMGQKKRVAMVVALVERKPLLLLDEWAADQDLQFRRAFYEELLPELRSRGQTILAATHDDRFFSMADQVVALDRGKRIQVPEPGSGPGPESAPESGPGSGPGSGKN